MSNRSAAEWARVCRQQAALTQDPQTRDLLLLLALEYDELVREQSSRFDDPALQDEVADRLMAEAARMRREPGS